MTRAPAAAGRSIKNVVEKNKRNHDGTYAVFGHIYGKDRIFFAGKAANSSTLCLPVTLFMDMKDYSSYNSTSFLSFAAFFHSSVNPDILNKTYARSEEQLTVTNQRRDLSWNKQQQELFPNDRKTCRKR